MTLLTQFFLIAILLQLPTLFAIGFLIWRVDLLRKTVLSLLDSVWCEFEDGR